MLIQTTDIHVNSSSLVIVYQYNVLNIITGYTTNLYSGASSDITSGITISSGFTLNLLNFPYNINRLDIIDNVIEYIYDPNLELNKYMLDILIVDSSNIYTEVSQVSQYCVKISMTNNFGCTIYEYLIMNIINEIEPEEDKTYYMPVEKIKNKQDIKCNILPIYVDPFPIIFYNVESIYNITGFTTTQYSGASSGITSGITISSGFTFNLFNFPYNINRIDIIDNIIDYTNLDVSKYFIDVLIVDEFQVYTEISEVSQYCIKFSLTNNIGCKVEDYFIMNIIYEIPVEEDKTYYMPVEKITTTTTKSCIDTTPIYVDSEPPIIVYQYGVITSFDSNTNFYTGVTSGITPNILIDKAFLLNIQGFDQNKITRIDVIDNIVDYVYDLIDLDVNKYMLEVLILDKNFIYTQVTSSGDYLIKLKISDRFGNSTEDYLIMRVVDGIDDVACFPGGMWRDNKVWIDTYLWMDQII